MTTDIPAAADITSTDAAPANWKRIAPEAVERIESAYNTLTDEQRALEGRVQALGLPPVLHAALIYGVIGRAIANDSDLARVMREHADAFTAAAGSLAA